MTVQYLIDSENVGDFWIPLLELPAEETELIVFYTRNSPHMSYDSLIRLKESARTVTFIKCYEGTNALDFQLVSELGYRISKNEDGRFVIVTNDTGFDAAVKYWRRRKKSVKRVTGKECKNLERRLREDLGIRTSGARSAAASDHHYIEPEHDAEQEEHTDVIREEAVQENEARPSRPNLRDAERAAQPDPEESDYMADADIEDVDDIDDVDDVDDADDDYAADVDRDDADLFASDRDAEDMENSAYDMDEDEEQGDSVYDIESAASDDFADDLNEAEDAFEAEEDGESFPVREEADPASADEDDHMQDESFSDVFYGEDTSAESAFEDKGGAGDDSPAVDEDDRVTAAEQAVQAGSEDSIEVHSETDQDKNPDSEDLSNEDADSLVTASAKTGRKTVRKKAGAGKSASVNEDNTALEVNGREPELDSSWYGTEDELEAPGEEQAAETAHRSRTRRSRSRRSKSTARKQEQAGTAVETGETAAAADSTQDRDASEAVRETSDSNHEIASGTMLSPEDEEIAKIVACIGADNLAELHNQLATIYGDQGKDIYLSIKNNARSLPVLKPDLKQKYEYYCEIIFARSDYTGEYPSDISEYLLNVREKLNNLTSLRYALQKHYGKEKGRRFYFLLKPYAKTMYQM